MKLKILILLFLTHVLISCKKENRNDLILKKWDDQTLNAVDSCSIPGIKRDGKEMLNSLSEKKVRRRILNDLHKRGILKETGKIYIMESSNENLRYYSAIFKFDGFSELYDYRYHKENDSISSVLLTEQDENYGSVIVYFDPFDMPAFICDKDFYLIDFYTEIDI